MTWPSPGLPSPTRITEGAVCFERLLVGGRLWSAACRVIGNAVHSCAEQCFGIFHCIQAHCVVLLRDVRGA